MAVKRPEPDAILLPPRYCSSPALRNNSLITTRLWFFPAPLSAMPTTYRFERVLLSVRYLRPISAPMAHRLAPSASTGWGRLAVAAMSVIMSAITPPTWSQPVGSGLGGGNTGGTTDPSIVIGFCVCSVCNISLAGW